MDFFKKELEAETKEFRENMQYLRNKRGYSQEKLAEIIGVDTDLIAAIENGDEQPDSEMIREIGEALGLSKYDTDMPESLHMLSGVVESIGQTMASNLLEILSRKEFSGFGSLNSNAKLNTKFGISSYLVFIMDVFATQKQNEQAHRAVFDATTSEILRSLQAISPEYSEKDFNKNLYERMDQYGEFIREPDTVFEIPKDIKISKVLWANLTDTLARKSIFKSKDRKIEILSLAYGVACQKLERNLRILLNEVFSENNDVRKLSSDKLKRLIEKAREKIDEIEKK
jgi:transcriptional regulator with XRE-family HTH domain